jgi:hypothetical protein
MSVPISLFQGQGEAAPAARLDMATEARTIAFEHYGFGRTVARGERREIN